MRQMRQIVVVGGGFAGTTLARALQHRLPAGWSVVLVSEESYTTFNPMLAEVVGASVFPEHVVAPIRQMLAPDGACRFVMGRVIAIDRAARTVRAETLAGVQAIGYDHLVLAFGTRANLALLPGSAEHALPLKLVGDALNIRNRVLQRLARIELEHDAALRRRLGHFVVIGGGFSGVELAGELADVLKSARRWYPRVQAHEPRVTLLHDGMQLLPELPASLGAAAAASLRARGVDVRLGAKARAVRADGVDLSDGGALDSATVICTIGTRPNPLVEQLGREGLPLERGRLKVLPDLAVAGAPGEPGGPGERGLWALGDCALVPNAAGGGLSPPTAQFAVAQAQLLAHNLVEAIAGRPTRAFAHRSRGLMATTGHLKGVALIGRLRLAGLPAWLLWRAFYLLRMPTLGRKLRLWVEWTWAMVFAADITHLRFTGTHEVDAPRAPALP
ncbi:MAG: FAD-dependent oxidoreductase [Burkholderiales bacterium]|nr:FAD-dependent oxidoreductase [Burkholderiales bacterium]